MPIKLDAVGQSGKPVRRRWSSKDALLYALGVGAGTNELAFTTENSANMEQRVLPTMAVILGTGGVPFDKLGDIDMAALLHGAQAIELFDEIPAEGEVETTGTITAIWDKGSGASIEINCRSINTANQKPLFNTTLTLFVRGEGNFGGERGPSQAFELPTRAADQQISYVTHAETPLIYRLSGDRNPLHSDPSFAKLAGFEQPILHGLCTYGFTGRALLHTLCESDPKRFKSMRGRFSKPVIPGDSLTISMWLENNECVFQTHNQHGDCVLDHGVMTYA